MIYNRFCGLYFRQALRKSEFGKKKICNFGYFWQSKSVLLLQSHPSWKGRPFLAYEKTSFIELLFPETYPGITRQQAGRHTASIL